MKYFKNSLYLYLTLKYILPFNCLIIHNRK